MLSTFAFNFNLRRYTAAAGALQMLAGADGDLLNAAADAGVLESLAVGMRRFGAEPAGVVARCRLTRTNPRRNRLDLSA